MYQLKGALSIKGVFGDLAVDQRIMFSFSSCFLPRLCIGPQKRHHPPTPFHVSSLHRENNATPPSTAHHKTLPATICNALDDLINNFVDPPALKPCFDPRHNLSGNFAPVDELPPTECHVVEGALPPSLDGAYIRNGPNPQFFPRGPYHFFDGDGMLHAITISNGKATLCSRYVKTYKYKIESQMGCPIFPKWFSGFNGIPASAARGAVHAARILSGQYNPNNGHGVANTSLALISGRLYALGESDLPYSVKVDQDGEIHTLLRHDFDGKLKTSMTAHPKTDAQTGETFAFRYGPMPPFLTFFRFNSNGEKQPDVPILSVTSPSLLHDFGITQKYAIFNDIQIKMMTGNSMVGVNPRKVPRIGVIPRYAADESEMRWFEVPGFNPLHVINAWDEDEGNRIVMVAPNMLSVDHTLERMDLVHALLEMVKIDLDNGVVTRHPVSARNLDLGVINPALIAKKNKYVSFFGFQSFPTSICNDLAFSKVQYTLPELLI